MMYTIPNIIGDRIPKRKNKIPMSSGLLYFFPNIIKGRNMHSNHQRFSNSCFQYIIILYPVVIPAANITKDLHLRTTIPKKKNS